MNSDEEAGAKKAGGEAAFSVPTCHVAVLQEPEKVADAITEAANNSIWSPEASRSSSVLG
jgi:hypothetical protein